jgi:hypothetical protein
MNRRGFVGRLLGAVTAAAVAPRLLEAAPAVTPEGPWVSGSVSPALQTVAISDKYWIDKILSRHASEMIQVGDFVELDSLQHARRYRFIDGTADGNLSLPLGAAMNKAAPGEIVQIMRRNC